MATIKDVSNLAKVSISTVSRVINNTAQVAPEKREAVLKAMEALHYRPNSFAQALVSKKSDCIGLLVGDLGGGPFFVQMMNGIEQVVGASGKYAIVMSGHHDEEKERHAIDVLLQRQCDALIIHSKALSDAELIQLAQGDKPIVFINRKIPTLEECCIYFDNEQGGYLATKYLIDHGHRDIAYVRNDLEDDGWQRFQGYQRALIEAGIEYDEQLVTSAYPDEHGGCLAIEELLSRGVGFTAVFGHNDAIIAGVISVLRDKGFGIPSDISVIGFDDIPYARYVYPKLTTVRYPITEMGARAAELAIHLLDKKKRNVGSRESIQLKFSPELVIRDSVL